MSVVESDVTTLNAYAHELLTACEQALVTTVGGIPARSCVSPGVPPIDCEQLTVHVLTVFPEVTSPTDPGTAQGHLLTTTGMLILAGFVVTVARCVPVAKENAQFIELPTVAELNAVSAMINQDLWAIWNRVSTMNEEGTIFGGRCKALYYRAAVPLDTAGGFAGWTLQFASSIDGYPIPSAT